MYLQYLTKYLPDLTCNIRLLLKLPQDADLLSQQPGTLSVHLFWTDVLINLFLAVICLS